MWWRILTFCLLVTLILFVVLSCIHGRPVIHLFFRRCCDEDIENDQPLFENFGNAFLKERLISAFEEGNITFAEHEFERKLNVHDPTARINAEVSEVEDKSNNDTDELETTINKESEKTSVELELSEVTTEGSDTLKISDINIDRNGVKVKVS